jgi:hypothetical protein
LQFTAVSVEKTAVKGDGAFRAWGPSCRRNVRSLFLHLNRIRERTLFSRVLHPFARWLARDRIGVAHRASRQDNPSRLT